MRRRGRRAIKTRTQALKVFADMGVDLGRFNADNFAFPASSDAKKLKKAYRGLVRDNHPDLPGNDRTKSTRLVMDLNGAYELLTAGDAIVTEDSAVGDEGFMRHRRAGGHAYRHAAFGQARPHEMSDAMRAQMHFMRSGPPNPAFGTPLVVGGEHMPTHPTNDALFFDPLADRRPVRRGGTFIERTPGYIVLLVPPDIAPSFMRAGMGSASAADWSKVKAWTDEQGLRKLFADMKHMSSPRVGRGRGPRGYLG